MAEVGTGVQEVPEFIMTSAEASCRTHRTEATHWTISALDSSMILLNAVVEILAVAVSDIRAKLAANRTSVTVMPVRGHPGRSNASHRFGRSKELFRRGHIAGLAQHHVHQSTSAVNRPVQIAPSAVASTVRASKRPERTPSDAQRIVRFSDDIRRVAEHRLEIRSRSDRPEPMDRQGQCLG